MISRIVGLVGAAISLVFSIHVTTAAAQEIARVIYLGQKSDSYYEQETRYTGLSLRERKRPIEALEIAMRGTRILSRALGIGFELEVVLLDDDSDGPEAIRAAFDAGAIGILLDLPAKAFQEAVSDSTITGPIFNIRHREDRWRGVDCAPNLLHTIPSYSMTADALAQHLRLRGWERVLLLSGDSDADAAEAEAVRSAITKFGLKLSDDRKFELTNDPRRRDQSNFSLLTGGVRHDVIWLVDNIGEFGRYLPFATFEPRPVVGSEGLTPLAWHWTYERHGAPQLNQRYRRKANRDMTSGDYAAWVAFRAIVESVSRLKTIDRRAVWDYMVSDNMSLDLYKGVPGGFRSWNGQLRQPILLATHNAVIGVTPYAGFEHQTDTLDTLGVDAQETQCKRPITR